MVGLLHINGIICSRPYVTVDWIGRVCLTQANRNYLDLEK